MSKYLSDILILTGCIAITAASAMISPILALFVGGGFCVGAGIALGVFRWLRTREKGTEQ